MGIDTGRRLAERLTREKGRLAGDLEVPRFLFFFSSLSSLVFLQIVKFICKDFWETITGKIANSLRTDNKGTFQVEDESLKFIHRLSAGENVNVEDEAQKFVVFPCGLIKGALDALGFDAQVRCEVTKVPSCKFVITSIAPQTMNE